MPVIKPNRQALTITIFCLVSLLVAGCGSTSGTEVEPLASRATIFNGSQGLTAGETEDLTPSGSKIPTRQPSPTSSPSAGVVAASSQPAFLNLVVGKSGFSQASGQLVYAFEVNNPNDTAVVDSIYQLLALDTNGRSLGSEIGRLPLLLPGQELGIAASMPMEDANVVEEIELLVTTGESLAMDTMPGLTVLDVYHRPSEIYDRVNGLIGNSSDRDLEDIRVSAVAYDENEDIVGAGYTFLSFLPAGESAGISIVLTAAEPVHHIKLFPRASLASLIQTPATRPPFTTELALPDSGFSQSDIEVNYGFLVNNPNISYNLRDTEYRVTFMNATGQVIGVDEGYIDLLVPQQSWGIGDRVFVDEGERVASMNILTRVSQYQPTLSKPALVVENVDVITDTLGIRVIGDLINPFDTTLDEVRLSALVYNSDGRIIGGGLEWINDVPPGATVPVEVRATAAEPVYSVDLYAGLTEIVSE